MYEELENIENPENLDSHFELDDSQKQFVDENLNNVGGEDLLLKGDIDANRDLVISTYDRAIALMRPDLKTSANLSPMKSYNSSWDRFIENYLESPYLESFSDKEQIELISDYMTNIEDIRFENWKDLTLEQRVNVLNEMEQHIAAIEHRPALPLYAEDMKEGMFGYQQHNPDNPTGDKIAINTSILEASGISPDLLDEVLDTLIHEGRHRYQHYNVEERLVHESAAEVETWRENIMDKEYGGYGYKDGSPIPIVEIGPIGLFTNSRLSELGFRLYYYQPIEIDARNFASDVMNGYHKKMEA